MRDESRTVISANFQVIEDPLGKAHILVTGFCRDDTLLSIGRRRAAALQLRWESALPVREAELKARETSAPTVDENHYALAVYGLTNRMAGGDPKTLASQLKKQAAL